MAATCILSKMCRAAAERGNAGAWGVQQCCHGDFGSRRLGWEQGDGDVCWEIHG